MNFPAFLSSLDQSEYLLNFDDVLERNVDWSESSTADLMFSESLSSRSEYPSYATSSSGISCSRSGLLTDSLLLLSFTEPTLFSFSFSSSSVSSPLVTVTGSSSNGREPVLVERDDRVWDSVGSVAVVLVVRLCEGVSELRV